MAIFTAFLTGVVRSKATPLYLGKTSEFHRLLAEVLATARAKVLQNTGEEECLPDERGAPT